MKLNTDNKDAELCQDTGETSPRRLRLLSSQCQVKFVSLVSAKVMFLVPPK